MSRMQILHLLTIWSAYVCAQSTSIQNSAASATSSRALSPSADVQKLECQEAQLYEKPEAWSSYSLPAVEEANGAVVNSSKNWNLTITLGHTQDDATTGAASLHRGVFLDTSSTIVPATNSTPFAICFLAIELPTSYSKKNDSGDCTTIFDQDCVRDLKTSLSVSAMSLAQPGQHINAGSCDAFVASLHNPPSSCKKFTNKGSDQLASTGLDSAVLNFTENRNYTSCPTRPTPPENLVNPYDITFTANTSVEEQAGITNPIILAVFTNSSAYSGPAFGNANLVCARPAMNTTGNIPLTSGALETIGNFYGAAVVALALNALLFFWL